MGVWPQPSLLPPSPITCSLPDLLRALSSPPTPQEDVTEKAQQPQDSADGQPAVGSRPPPPGAAEAAAQREADLPEPPASQAPPAISDAPTHEVAAAALLHAADSTPDLSAHPAAAAGTAPEPAEPSLAVDLGDETLLLLSGLDDAAAAPPAQLAAEPDFGDLFGDLVLAQPTSVGREDADTFADDWRAVPATAAAQEDMDHAPSAVLPSLLEQPAAGPQAAVVGEAAHDEAALQEGLDGLSDVSTETDGGSDRAADQQQARQPAPHATQAQVKGVAANAQPHAVHTGDVAEQQRAVQDERAATAHPSPTLEAEQQHHAQDVQQGIVLLEVAELLEARIAGSAVAGNAVAGVEDASYQDDLLFASIVSQASCCALPIPCVVLLPASAMRLTIGSLVHLQLEPEEAAVAGDREARRGASGTEGTVLGRLAAARAFLSPSFEQVRGLNVLVVLVPAL